jgi:superfamily II DNA or RNA helicase
MTDSLAARFFNQVDRASQERGRRYFLRGAVSHIEGDSWSAHAVVQGTQLYDVDISTDRHLINASCTCPFFQREFEACKHIWAALLAADQSGFLSALKTIAAPHLRGVPANTAATKFAAARRKVRKLSESTWKAQLLSVRNQLEAVEERGAARIPGERELHYFIDAAGTAARGELTLQVGLSERKMDGNWGKLRFRRLHRGDIPLLRDSADRRILATLLGAHDQVDFGYSGYSSYASGESRFVLSPALWELILQPACAAGRCVLRRSGAVSDHLTLEWDDGNPWELCLRVSLSERGKRYRLTGVLRRDGSEMPLSEPILLVGGGLVFYGHRVGRLNDFGAFPWISLLRNREGIVFAKSEADEFIDHLTSLPRQTCLDLPEELRFERITAAPKPSLLITPGKPDVWGRDFVTGELSFDYNGSLVAAKVAQRSVFQKRDRRVIERDAKAEAAAAARLTQLGFHESRRAPQAPLEAPAERVAKIVRTLTQEGWRVEAQGKLYRRAGRLRLEINSSVDWFDLQGSAEFGETAVPLPKLLRAIKHGEDTVRLDDGSLGIIPEEWLAKYRLLAGLGEADADHLRFARPQAGLLDLLLGDEPEMRVDPLFERMRNELRGFAGIEPADPGPTFRGVLRDYQRAGLGWLGFLQRFGLGGCLADDMGLGKTIQVLALLDQRRSERMESAQAGPGVSLVVVPRSLIFHWREEAARFAPRLRIFEHAGAGRRHPGQHFGGYDLIITTYGTLARDALHFKNVHFDYCVLDEAQAIKNAGTLSAKAARLIHADHRLALSGTPVQNHLGELWSLFEFLNPGMLGGSGVFGGAGRNPDAALRATLARALRPFILRRTKTQVAKELPAKTEQTIYCDLEGRERRLYEEMRDYYRARLLNPEAENGVPGRFKFQVLEALLRLRQAACHSGLIDKARAKEPSAKLDVLLAQLEQVLEEDHKALVFSQFTSLLTILRQRLDAANVAYAYLDGRTRDRQARVEQFQNDPATKLFLISLKAGGLGLNLHAAEYVYLLDPWWNPAVEAQAIDRAHRIGQTRQVFAYRLIARDTVEDKVVELQQSKRELADAIISADNSLLHNLTREDLELLLS